MSAFDLIELTHETESGRYRVAADSNRTKGLADRIRNGSCKVSQKG